LLIALSSNDIDLRSLLPDVWIAAHPEHFLQYRHDEAEAAACAEAASRRTPRQAVIEFPRGPDTSAAIIAVPP
jgi:hypothetical protein